MRKCQQAEEQRYRACLADTQFNNAGVGVKQPYQPGCKNIAEHTDRFRQHHCGQNAETRPLLRPVVLPGAQVLADKGRTGHIEAGDWQECKALNLGMGAVSSHSQLSERVNL